MPTFFDHLRMWRKRRNLSGGLDDELQHHIEEATKKNVRAGMTPAEAARVARSDMGGVEATKDYTRDEFRLPRMDDMIRDARHALRSVGRARAFAIAGILTLGLGIGVTTAMFSVVRGVLLRPLPYANQDRLIEIVHAAPSIGANQLYSGPAIYFTYRDNNRTFDLVGQWNSSRSPVTVSGAGDPEAVLSTEVTHEVLGVLGVTPIAGRMFNAADDQRGSVPTAVISYDYWQRHFGGGDAVGRTLVVDGVARNVIGVLPRSFRFFTHDVDIFYPLQFVRADAGFPSFSGRAIARLKQGVTLAEANADVARMIPLVLAEFGGADTRMGAALEPRLRSLRASVIGELDETLWLLMVTIGLLLLIACANVANLVLVRAQGRRAELALRVALGAGWSRVARVLLLESAAIGIAGGLVGLGVAYLSLPYLVALSGDVLPELMAVTIDPVVLLFCLGISLVTTVLFGTLPVLQASLPTARVAGILRTGGRTVTEGRREQRSRQLLLVSQVALAVILLTGAGLMARTYDMLRRVDPGLRDPEHALTFQITVPGSNDRIPVLRRAIVERFATVPGTAAVAFSAFNDALPLDNDGRTNNVYARDQSAADNRETIATEMQYISPSFFDALGTPLVAGRAFDWSDVDQARPVAMVSANLARRIWGSTSNALGKQVSNSRNGPWRDVIGVVQDVHHNGLNEPAPEAMMLPAVPSSTSVFVVRGSRVGTPDYVTDLRHALKAVDPSLSLAHVRSMGDLYRKAMARTSLTLSLLTLTGASALLLVLIGTYGIVSYGVARRRREIGIRLALGARSASVRRMFVTRALALVGAGLVVGNLAAIGLTRWLSSQLFGVTPLDPVTHLSVATVLFTATAAAGYVSTRVAARLNPIDVLTGD